MTTVKLRHRYHRLAPPNEGVFEAGATLNLDDDTAKQLAAQNAATVISVVPDPITEQAKPNLVTVDWAEENKRMKETVQ
jgi:hypothetical protein